MFTEILALSLSREVQDVVWEQIRVNAISRLFRVDNPILLLISI